MDIVVNELWDKYSAGADVIAESVFKEMMYELNKKHDADLVSFGSYLISEIREKRIGSEGKRTVNHADIENWKNMVANIKNQ